MLSVEILVESFEPIDLLFLGLAGFAAYKYSFRIIPLSLEHNKSYEPEFAKLRLPLAGVSAVLIGVCLFLVSSQSEIEKVYYYESGDMLSKGMLRRGVVDGEWEYYYEGGGLGSRGVYSNGLEEGVWEYFDESGGLSSTQEYHRGLLHGSTIAYYDDDLVYQQGTYQYGRMHGEWTTYYESKAVSNKGSYSVDRPDGAWEYYHENGNLFQKGSFLKGEKTGIWKTWDERGELIEELDHLPNQEVAWITFRDQVGNASVENGNGNFVSYHPDGAIATTGAIKENKMHGE